MQSLLLIIGNWWQQQWQKLYEIAPGCVRISIVIRTSNISAKRNKSCSASSTISSNSSSGKSSGGQQRQLLQQCQQRQQHNRQHIRSTSRSSGSGRCNSNGSSGATSGNRNDADGVGALLVVVTQKACSKRILRPQLVAVTIVAVVARWGRRFASSRLGPRQVVSHEFCVRFRLLFGFVKIRETTRKSETA